MTSKINLELKHYCPDFVPVRNILKNIGAKKIAILQQKDYFFHLPQGEKQIGRLKLRIEHNAQTLIYYERPDFESNKKTASRVELYEVHDKKLLPFLSHTLEVKAVVQKKREIWRKTNTVFHLDSVKGVGNIFEIELQKRRGITQRDKEIFQSYQKKLLPHLGMVVAGSNIDLVTKK